METENDEQEKTVCRTRWIKIAGMFINLPGEAAFDTRSLKQDLQEEVKSAE